VRQRLRISRHRHRLTAMVALAGICLTATVGCSRYTPSYDRDDNVNGGLVSEMHTFAGNLSSGRGAEIIVTETVPGFLADMGRFIKGHAGRPVRIVHIGAEGDQVAAEHLAITCHPNDIQHVTVNWRWQDGGWRGWPDVRGIRPCD
jgi:hypothetical protein